MGILFCCSRFLAAVLSLHFIYCLHTPKASIPAVAPVVASLRWLPGCGTTASPNPVIHTGSVQHQYSGDRIQSGHGNALHGPGQRCLQSAAAAVRCLRSHPADYRHPGFGANCYWLIDNQSGATVTINVVSPSNLDGSATVTSGCRHRDVVPVRWHQLSFRGAQRPRHRHRDLVHRRRAALLTSPTPLVNAGTVFSSVTPTIITAANPPISASYCGGVEQLNNGSNQIPTIGQAGSAGFPSGWSTTLCNIGAGTQTVTPTGGTIGGLTSYVLNVGSRLGAGLRRADF